MRILIILLSLTASILGFRAEAASRSDKSDHAEKSDDPQDSEKSEKSEESENVEKPRRSTYGGRFGLGIVVAGPTGITGQYRYDKKKDLTASVGWGWDVLHLNLDHHWNNRDWIKAKGTRINVYYGIGLRWINYDGRSKTTNEIGLRFPVGVQHIIKSARIQIFFEVAPALTITPSSNFLIDLALGARYFF